MTRARVIGVDGKLPWHYGDDLKRFKRRTIGCAVLMGRVTWDSLGRSPLPGRRNIVVSRAPLPGVEHYRGIEPALRACADDDLWVIGGAQIYRAALAHLNLLDVTYVPDSIERNDAVKFPPIDPQQWEANEETTFGDADLRNVIYRRRSS
ncbi:MAG: dihydrofolate reductase [bacterium]